MVGAATYVGAHPDSEKSVGTEAAGWGGPWLPKGLSVNGAGWVSAADISCVEVEEFLGFLNLLLQPSWLPGMAQLAPNLERSLNLSGLVPGVRRPMES